MSLYENYPFGKPPCKKGDRITVRGKGYEVTKIEPTFYAWNTTAVNGETDNLERMVPRSGIMHYFQYLTVSAPNVGFGLERPEGQPRIVVDQVRQYLPSIMFGPNTPGCVKFSVMQGESFGIRYEVAADTPVIFHFYGFKMHIKALDFAGEFEIEDFPDYSA
jgi:hypothetical protein